MDIEDMKKQIREKCFKIDCDKCPLCLYDCFEGNDVTTIKENYELMFPQERKRKVKGEDMSENYAVINGEKIELNDEIIETILNYKEYNIGHIEIKPNWSEGYNSDEQYSGAIYIGDDFESISVTHKELPKVIEALTEIQNYLNKCKRKSKGENYNEI